MFISAVLPFYFLMYICFIIKYMLYVHNYYKKKCYVHLQIVKDQNNL